jgi:DMSO/TMAO reductase YedYZ molybdopterin-dependent catalytic subunit
MSEAQAPGRLSSSPDFTPEELALAARNHGMPLEAMRWDITPLGLHYLLIHYDIPVVDAASWEVEVGGRVARPLRLTLADLMSRPARSVTLTMECAGNGRARAAPRALSQPWLVEAVGTATWTGVPLRHVLGEAGVSDDTVELVFTGRDRGAEGDGRVEPYERALEVGAAMGDDVLLAYQINGQPLTPQHGFPVRLVVPGWYGMGNVKWLCAIRAVSEPFTGFQNQVAYRLRQTAEEPGEPVTRIQPRALMVPPGDPDFYTRRRLLAPGTHELFGRAWSGWATVTAVEVSVDGGATWEEAKLGANPVSSYAWRSWTFDWEAANPGDYELCCRARDASGRLQPVEADWNLHGFANNTVQRVPVTVR